MPFTYDDQNIFAKILRGEIPNDTVMETEHTLVFRDIRPQAPQHVLVIPKGAYETYDHFALEASDAEIVDFTRVVGKVAAELGVQPSEGAGGFRLISNAGEDPIQEVPHMHVHLVAGRALGPILPKMG
ncbi:MAG: HIT domain-containing protein [Pseudomonadota bacterium]